jgi:hypothetical protein
MMFFKILEVFYIKYLLIIGLFGFTSVMLSLIIWTFIDTTLADKLEEDF